MLIKTVLLIVASQGYQPLEYSHTRKVLEEAGIKVIVASNEQGIAHANINGHQTKCGCQAKPQPHPQPKPQPQIPNFEHVTVDVALNDVNPDNYDGIFIIGGQGALQFLDTQATYDIMKRIAESGKPFGAICISPRILASAGLLNGKRATGWNGDNNLGVIFKQHNVSYIKEHVVTDGNLVTADGPQSAVAFGKAIVTLLQKKT